ncbi:MAG: YihY/virulence factor BrkB family protein [Lachnospiraceae bacterium]|nr:YihY/virulence factor BrkB family protein [Lachnospiraceae bacterium]
MYHTMIHWYIQLTKMGRKIADDYISAFAAQSTYFFIICFFPFTMFFLMLIQYTPITKETLEQLLIAFLPDTMQGLVSPILEEFYTRPSGALLSLSAIVTLWMAGKVFIGLSQALNKIYEVKERRNYLIRRIASTITTLVMMLCMIAMLLLSILSNSIMEHMEMELPFLGTVITFLRGIFPHRFIVSILLLTLFFMFLYKLVPNRKSTLMKEFPGALFSALGWQGFSVLFSYYLNTNDFQAMYGSLTTIVIALLWIYFCIYILLLGAECNVLIQNNPALNHRP